jgi:hypothetical protein
MNINELSGTVRLPICFQAFRRQEVEAQWKQLMESRRIPWRGAGHDESLGVG